ncbi:hypothetical protein B0H14DRAFT_2585745 [Mycena olivaceomarginata]|nr:hypothetical protein B0H14DRAFT_2585745 [Mycena olivaceomarginata]
MTSFTPVAPGAASAPVAAHPASSDGNVPIVTPPSANLTCRSCPAQTAAALHNLVLVLGVGTNAPAASPDADSPAASSAVTPAALPNVGFQTRGPWVADPVPEGFEPLWYCITRGKHVGVTIHNSLAMACRRGSVTQLDEELQNASTRSRSVQ